MRRIAVVTGASAGLGEEFVIQLDPQYEEIWIVARRKERLDALSDRLSHAKAVIIEADLTKQEQRMALIDRVEREGVSIGLLVNNAGYGKYGAFTDLTRSDHLGVVELNISALTDLTYLALPFMQAGSTIIQVASLAAFCVIPYFSVYTATKSYVLSLAIGLAEELKERQIQVLALCPGPVATEFVQAAVSAGDENSGWSEKGSLTSKRVVRQCLKDLSNNKRYSLIRFNWKLVPALSHLLSRRFMATVTGRFMKKFVASLNQPPK